MKLELTSKQYRRLLDMVYIGNWILNSMRATDRIADFDELESYIFSHCEELGMSSLYEKVEGIAVPSRAFSEGGIHEAIMDYEDTVFFEILAEELAHRDLYLSEAPMNAADLASRIHAYIAEFEQNGISNILVDTDL